MATTRRMLLGSLFSAVALCAASVTFAAGKVTKIGILAPLTGGSAADGEEMVRGLTLAVEEANAKGGVAGYTFEVVQADTRNQQSDAVASAVERLLGEDNLNMIMTGYASGSNFEIVPIAEGGVPYFLSANSQQTRDIVTKDPSKYWGVWSLTPSYDAYETELVPVVQGLEKEGKVKLPGKKVALISSDNPYSKGIYEGLSKSFTAAGWSVTDAELVPFGEINDWHAFLAKVRQNPPDIVINTDYQPANAATFMSQFMEQPTKSLVFIQYAPSVPEFLKLTADRSSGVIYNLLGGVLNTPKDPLAGEILAKFKKRWGVDSGSYGVALYEQAQIYFNALAKVGDPAKRNEIGAAIGASDTQTAEGRIVFDQATHLAKQGNDYVPIQFYQIWKGERVLFYPSAYATGEFREPDWMK
jgi:branched-chain amino acid transport system substrate-binding protein